jgi:SEC-C motif
MLSILKNKLSGYDDLSKLKENINELYIELSRKNYDKIVNICKLNHEICNRIKENAVELKNEDVANSMFVAKAYSDLLKNYAIYWKMLEEGRYRDSWIILQDTIDKLILVTKFHSKNSDFSIDKFNNHMTELEKLYPYKIFASSEMVIKSKKCSICRKSLLDLDCTHIPGNLYWGEMAVAICGDIQYQAVALVQHPLNKRCVMELSGDSRSDKEKFGLLDYFVKHVDNPFQLFSVNEEEKVYFNEYYDSLGRNDKCFCGSGKKFKKCHGITKYERGLHLKIILEDKIILEPLKIAVDKVSVS